MKSITVITPAYNRANLLKNLYVSLKKQTSMDFCWMVIDDGSTDNTYDVICRLIVKAPFEIMCLKKENGGKHTALNYGIKKIKTPLTIIVDSDDLLTPDAIQSILDVHRKYSDFKNIGSYTFLKGYNSEQPVVSNNRDEFIANYISYRIKGHRPGDMAEVFKTEVLQKYSFPEFPGEKFLSEDVVWIEIGKESDSVYINKIIYICKYLEGGLTSSDKKMKFASPLGSMMRGKQLMYKACGLRENVRGAIIFNVYKKSYRGDSSEGIRLNSREKLLVSLLKIPSLFFFRKWKKIR